MKAYDILTDGVLATVAGDRPRTPAGWAGPEGPAIDVRTWPRSPRTGQPMLHCFTLWLPADYRLRGPDLVAVSVFQWDDELYFGDPLPEVIAARSGAPVPADPFWAEVARATPHPHTQVADDGVACLYALRWLTEAEFTGPRVERPAENPHRADGEVDVTEFLRTHGRYGALWLVDRDDPNAGVAPVDFPDDEDDYVDEPDRFDVFHPEHLGGTSMDPNGPRQGLSAFYLEVNRLGGFSHGGDEDLALDLDGGSFLG